MSDEKKVIEIEKVRMYDKPGTLKAFCSLRIGGVTIKDCKIVELADGRRFVSMPSQKDKDGKYHDYVYLSKSVKDKVDAELAAVWPQYASGTETGTVADPVTGEIPF